MTFVLQLQRWNCTFDIIAQQIMQFLQGLLIVLLLYFLLRILGRWFAPRLFQYAVKKTEQRFREQFEAHQGYHEAESPEGEVSISSKPGSQKKSKESVGEYIDFEEID